MNIRVLLVLLAISLMLACIPRWRKPGAIASVLFAALLIWFTVKQSAPQPQPAPTNSVSSAAQVSRTPPIVTLRLEGNGAPWRISGSITNSSDTPIRSITLQVERLDCPVEDSQEMDCAQVWRGQHTLRMLIAAHATVKIDESFYSHEPVPRLKGAARDDISVINLR